MDWSAASYSVLTSIVEDAGLLERVRTLSEWENTMAGIMSVAGLARSLDLVGGSYSTNGHNDHQEQPSLTPSMSVEWRYVMPSPDGNIIEFLHAVGARAPLRVWMVGILEDHELQPFERMNGYVFTSLRPLLRDSLVAANAILAHWAHREDIDHFQLFKPADAVQASAITYEPLNQFPLPDVVGYEPHWQPLTITTVARVFSMSFVDVGGQPLPHVFATFLPLYYADALSIQQLLCDLVNVPDDFDVFELITAPLRADRRLAEETGNDSAAFVPFESVFDGRNGYRLDGGMPRLNPSQILEEDLATGFAIVPDDLIDKLNVTWLTSNPRPQ
ncbi:hypothetical protein BV25DRAFT_1915945 [Artomyces pyxidatus]|uniref:Uncharacterized protein n=1 Tax=Artomyces pyxidatus TaxID=48021 RepID=A0ACB8T0Q9_9AGAM|nr:hypothetical protein BV25DRAFT_1915945 [Artomyces pyxidatus]